MTPFGARLRALRAARGVTLRALAGALQVSPAYLSALEHGRRGAPGPGLVHQVNEYFGLIWDEADDLSRLARISAIALSDGAPKPGSAQILLGEATLILPLADLIDLDAERTRLERDQARAAAELEKVQRKLQNADFVARAKPEVVEENRERERQFSLEIERLSHALARLH